MHEKDWYLSLGQRKDTIECMDGDLDITGWDLRKCLSLLKKSNTPLIERFQSPIEYYSDETFKNEFKDLINTYYSPTAVFYHHYSLAKKFQESIQDSEEMKLKGYFYLLRSLLSCNWIIKDKSVLPMDIEGLMQLTNETNRTTIRNLIALKATVGEKYLHTNVRSLNNLTNELFSIVESSKDNLGVNNNNMTLLDQFFLKTLNANSDN